MKNLLFIVMAFICICSCAKPEGFVIKGQIEGNASGQICLLKYDNGKWINEDSTNIQKGEYVLKGKTNLPELRRILLKPQTFIAQPKTETSP
jgi:hypothetical protein